MDEFKDFLNAIEDADKRTRTKQILQFVSDQFPHLGKRIGWNQPIFTDHGTYIVGFSISKKHLGLGLENVTMDKLSERIKEAGYTHTKMVVQLPWDKDIDYDLIREIVAFNIKDKEHVETFWH